VLYVFGAFDYDRYQDVVGCWQRPNLDDNPALKLLRRLLPVSKNYD
jgi:tellurite resistance protein TerC